MNCLNEYQLEYLIKKPTGIKGVFWRSHLKKCIKCRENFEEISENNSFLDSFKNENIKKEDFN